MAEGSTPHLSPGIRPEIRFARDWRAIAGAAHGARTLLALSGGPDSTALLLLLADIGHEELHAATVDHGMRAEAADEAAHAAEVCAGLGVPHSVLSGPLPQRAGITANLSARARRLRYALLEEHADAIGARWIATAHHADDQLETLVMRLNRGTGVRGLAGIRARRGRVVRPLLGWRRADLAAIVAAAGIAPVADPSNIDDRFDRARLRKKLADADWLDPAAAARSAAALADVEVAIGWTVDRLFGERCRRTGDGVLLDPADLPAELVRRLVEHCLVQVDPGIAPRGPAIDRALARLAAGEGATLGGVRYRAEDAGWSFSKAPPHRSFP